MKTLQFRLEMKLDCSIPVRDHQFVLRCCPPEEAGQHILYSRITVEPFRTMTRSTDCYGNLLLSSQIEGEHTHFGYCSEGKAEIDRSRANITAIHPSLRYPGDLTRPGPELTALNETLNLKGLSDAEKAERIYRTCSELLSYTPGVTGTRTTAEEALTLKKGVCQDFAHIFVALCRMNSLPARYCAGLTVGEGATHAWAEAALPGGWVGFDPTRRCMVNDSYLVLSRGRDYADCPLERGVFIGLCDQTQTVFAKVWDTNT